ncbi:hypothetical protein [uncultured Rikenella sp.]|uniref:hypothetical protein n=1 Tax=uncultured Rikenella sp. TaxID=368003 RepID=UPI002628AFED|nr:hypothetical protein [uncultured Rikenella sp.]
MTLQEFSERTGLMPTVEEYRLIENMYMTAGNMDKDTFCRDYKKHAGSMILAELLRQVKIREEQLAERKEELKECRVKGSKIAFLLVEQSSMYPELKLCNLAAEMVGYKEVVRYKIERGLPLEEVDKEYIIGKLK